MHVMEAIRYRRSVRLYCTKPIEKDVLERMRKALRYAPSACNHQPWRFIFVMDEGLRGQVARACREQMWMAEAPVIVAGCGRADEAYKKMGGYGSSVDVDVAIALDHLTLAAVAEGLGTCWIGAFDEGQVKQILGVPEEVKVVALTPLGYPKQAGLIAPVQQDRRKPEAEIIRTDQYDGESF